MKSLFRVAAPLRQCHAAVKSPWLRFSGRPRLWISPSARIAFEARLDKTNPGGIVNVDQSYVASGALVLPHDFCRGLKTDTVIGRRCLVGANAVVMPGVQSGDRVIVGGGSVESNSRR